MKEYLDCVRNILENGEDRPDRTGVGTRALFAELIKFNMKDGYPAMTTKKLAFYSMAAELFWFLSGSPDEKYLEQMGSKIWKANAEADYWKPKARFKGDVGRNYGVQWRDWINPEGERVDQIEDVIKRIKGNPFSRRHIVTAWNPGEIQIMALPPCHMIFQFHVHGNGGLSLTMYQRSCDMFLGVPFNIASYALLLHIIAQVTELEPRGLAILLGDAHIYNNHFDQVKGQLSREPRPLPELWLSPDIDEEFIVRLKERRDLDRDDIRKLVGLKGYRPHPPIKATMAV